MFKLGRNENEKLHEFFEDLPHLVTGNMRTKKRALAGAYETLSLLENPNFPVNALGLLTFTEKSIEFLGNYASTDPVLAKSAARRTIQLLMDAEIRSKLYTSMALARSLKPLSQDPAAREEIIRSAPKLIKAIDTQPQVPLSPLFDVLYSLAGTTKEKQKVVSAQLQNIYKFSINDTQYLDDHIGDLMHGMGKKRTGNFILKELAAAPREITENGPHRALFVKQPKKGLRVIFDDVGYNTVEFKEFARNNQDRPYAQQMVEALKTLPLRMNQAPSALECVAVKGRRSATALKFGIE